jgi:hypothetical protein
MSMAQLHSADTQQSMVAPPPNAYEADKDEYVY